MLSCYQSYTPIVAEFELTRVCKVRWCLSPLSKVALRDPDLHNHALDALMKTGGESFNDSTNHQKKFKSGGGRL